MNWNWPAYWTEYYRNLLADPDPWRREWVVHRQVDLLIGMLTRAGELPRSSPQTLLDAGCGIALLPHLLEFWGFQVTAIDFSPLAIEVASGYLPDEEELARCIPIWEPCSGRSGVCQQVADPARSLERLRNFRRPGGATTFLNADWFTTDLRPGSFGLVHCRNSLRCSTRAYWRRSLRRFHDLLTPGGMLLLENVNAVGIQEEMEDLLAECGFLPLAAGAERKPSARYVLSMWPTG